MLGKTMQEALNEQINHELYSAYLYLGMSAWATERNLPGFAHWLMVQAEEEQSHALKLYNHILDRGGHVALAPVKAPPAEFKSILDLFQNVLTHEQKVTALIHKLRETSLKEKDYAAEVELAWFVKEQVEEEKNATEIVAQLEMVGDKGSSLLMLDHQLGKRAKE